MKSVHSFNIFRINCLLSDINSTTFDSIIISIVCEMLYEDKNKPVDIKEVYTYIKDYLKITLEIDYLEKLLNKGKFFLKERLHETYLISLTPEKFLDVEQKIETNSIEKLISSFLVESNKDFSLKLPIENLLYLAIYENMNSFSIDNLKSLLPVIKHNFSQEEIDAYNAFLDYDDAEKNKAIYKVLANAVEFAILTSGKGIKEIKFDLFKGKIFLLDTNIIFRLLGIGGEERKQSTFNFLKKCLAIGMNFMYTAKTHQELTNKLTQIISYLKNSKLSTDTVTILGDLAHKNPDLYNDDFIIHYSRLVKTGQVTTPERYELLLMAEARNVFKQLNANIASDTIEKKNEDKLAKLLYDEKKKYTQYSHKASVVDAHNVLVVQKKRGANNHNYSDIKCFYLTVDRSLNKILAKECGSLIPESILPSQLYILSKPFFDSSSDNDYSEFVKFIKKRKTGFKYGGSQVVNLINSVKTTVTDVDLLNDTLISYADIRYRDLDSIYSDSSTDDFTFKDLIRTAMDERLELGNQGVTVQANLKKETEKWATQRLKNVRIGIRAIDFIITIIVLPLIVILQKEFIKNLWILGGLILLIEGIKFYLSSRFKFFQKLHLFFYKYFTSSRLEYVSKIDTQTALEISNNYKVISEAKSIW